MLWAGRGFRGRDEKTGSCGNGVGETVVAVDGVGVRVVRSEGGGDTSTPAALGVAGVD